MLLRKKPLKFVQPEWNTHSVTSQGTGHADVKVIGLVLS